MSKFRRTGNHGAALQAAISLAFVVPAAAQPMPNARPQGGQVVAGTASIAAGVATTTVTQSTNRAAIDWHSFDVGSNQSVIFQQPGASSVTLNRVTGPDPSAIAGRISANGQLVLTNPSGVVFHAGAQVNAQSVIVSAPGITNQNFMAGRMVFDQPGSPNARITNAGTITVKEAGLAALVAPSVANSGTITARLGHVVLAGAATHTLDMYGDGLVSIDITKQVTQAPVGPDGKTVTALVTNSGTIAADGGTVQLSARAADGVVSTLVQAGGRIQANTVGSRVGQIEIAGTGGSVVIEGRVAADGRGSGTTGGTVVVAGSAITTIGSAARITANGRAGGGTVAVGTTLARARGTGAAPAGTSARTVVAAGARISADATGKGDGGRVTVLSTDTTTMGGAVTARGGKSGGNGGTIELSGETGFRLTGSADTSAPHGALGTVVLDPRDLTITSTANGTANPTPTDGTDPNLPANQGGTTTDAYVTPAQIQALTGNVRLQATRDLVVASDLEYQHGNGSTSGANLTLEAGRNLTVNSGVTITVPGSFVQSGYIPGVLTLSAATNTITGYDPAGTLTIAGNLQTSGLTLKAGTGGIVLSGSLSTKSSNETPIIIDATSILTTGSVVQTTGSLITGSLSGTAASIALVAAGNQISAINGNAPLTATLGGVTITTSTPLTVTAGASSPGITAATGATISLLTDNLTLTAGGAGVPALSAPGGTVALQPMENGRDFDITSSATKPSGALALTTAETGLINAATLQFYGPTSDITFGQPEDVPVDLVAHGNFSQILLDTGGVVVQNAALIVNSLSNAGSPVNLSSVTLQNSGNSIPSIGSLTVNGSLALSTSGTLTVSGAVSANATLSLGSSGNMTVLASATLSGPNGATLTVDNEGSGSLTIAGTVSSSRGLNLTAGTGGVNLSGTINPGQALDIESAGPLAQTGGAITGGTLFGNATQVSLPSRSNSLSGVSDFTASSGDFLLVNSAPLQVYAPGSEGNNVGLTVQTGQTVTLVTDNLSISGSEGGGFGISAAGGTVVVAPYTAGGAVLLTSGAKPATGLSLTTSELALIDASTLQLGGTSSTVPQAGSITVGQAGDGVIDLGTAGFTRLVVSASGAVTQNAALGVITLAGTAGSVALSNGGNFITVLDGLTATGDIALHTSSGLTVSNAVTAGGNLTLSTEAVIDDRSDNTSLLLAANVTGATVRFDTTDGDGGASGILQSAGIVTAGTLTGAASTLSLPQANQISTLGDFTTSGALAVTNGRALAVTGAVTSTAGAVTLNAQGITQTATSSITAGELDGSSSADTVLDSRLNAVSSMGTFSQSSGNFTLVTSSPELNFGGNTGQVSATTGSLTFVADSVGLVTEPAAGTSISAPAGLITFSPFTAGLPIALINTFTNTPANSALTLSASFRSYLHSDTLALGSTGYTGPISIGGANETIDLSAFRALQVQTSGAVTEGVNVATDFGNPGDSRLTVSSLNGSAGSIVLPNNNTIANLGQSVAGGLSGLAATSGPLTVATGVGLTLNGPISASTVATLSTTAGLSIVNSLIAPTVTLTAGGAVSEASTSAKISATTLGITAASATLPGTGNQIATLTSAVSGNLALTDATALNVTGGSTIGGTLNLTIAGALAGGNLAAGSLTGSATSVALTAGGNQIASLGPFTSTGGFSLTDATALTVAGAVSDPSSITLNVSGNLTVAGAISGAPGIVTLNASGTITEPGGSIAAGTLTGSATSAVLTAAGNQIASLGPFSSTGGFSLVDATALTVAGAVSDPTSISLNASSNLTLAGAISSASGTVTLTASRSITQTGGAISAGTVSVTAASAALSSTGNRFATLTGAVAGDLTVTDATAVNIAAGSTIGGTLNLTVAGAVTGGTLTAGALTGNASSVALTAAGNQIASLGPFTSSGGFSLVDARALTVAGTVSDPTAITLNVGGDLAVAAALSSPQGVVTLNSAGTITQTGGAITAGTMITSAGSVLLSQAGNSIATLTSAVSGNLTLTNASALAITGGSTIGGTLNLTVAGPITGGNVSAQTLTGSAASVALTAGGIQIASLGPFTSTGGFSLVDARPLTVAGPVSDPTSISLNVNGNLTLAAALSSPQGTVTLSSSGSIIQSGGAITAGSLTGGATGSAVLGQAGNSVATLAGFTTGGDFTLADGRSLVVSGPVDPNTVSMTVKGDLTLNSSVTGGTVMLDVTGAIIEGPGGRIVADNLTSRAGSAALNGANQVATLGAFATTTGFSLTNVGAVTVNGPSSDGQSIAIAASGPITLAGDVSAPAVSLSATGGGITQIAGTLTAAATLTVSTTGAVTQSGGNFGVGTLSGSADSIDLGRGGPAAIGRIAGLAATGRSPGTLTILDNMPLSLSGTISGRFVSITAAGSLTLSDGTVIRTDGQPAVAQLGSADASPGSNLSVQPGSDGRGTLIQLGTVAVAPLTAGVATLRIDIPSSGGTIALSNLQAGNADLVLSLGSGTATGPLVVRNLTVLGSSGQATLSGTVKGLSGDQAAASSALLPRFDLRYTLNGCAISLASCSVTGGVDAPSIFQPDVTIASVIASAISSVIRPDILALDVLDLSVTRDRDDPTLLLPNISDKDY